MVETLQEVTKISTDPKADVGSLFISNYPPFSVWNRDHLGALEEVMEQAPIKDTPLGLYIHIPFCRKRCKFCYFKVYTGKNSREIQDYLDHIRQEVEMVSKQPALRGRKLDFLYIGGGTPSYISARHLRALISMIKDNYDCSELSEFTFECEPGTLTEAKLKAIRDVGVTRLSLGVENFDDHILEINGRAHLSAEIYKVEPWLHDIGYNQLNIDLISGMVGENWDNWKANIDKTIAYGPDSVTIYQLELPYNTVFSSGILKGDDDHSFADWNTKRAWHSYAIDTLSANGYEISSAYTMVRKDRSVKFRYRDALWRGADLVATGVSSFGHISGVHYQNDPSLQIYKERVDAGFLPVKRAFHTTPETRLIREMILQLKMGRIERSYFQDKFGVDIIQRFGGAYRQHEENGMLIVSEDSVTRTRDGLLRVDGLLPAFYQEEFQGVRYT
jgi:oxygen-independent coproporphyrinogen-3 oxidase